MSFVNDISIKESIDSLTDTCKLTIPKNLRWNGQHIAVDSANNPVFKRGMSVYINLGYDDVLKARFIGYLKDIKSGVPITLECEDSMFLLKRKPLNYVNNGKSLQSFLNNVLQAAGITNVKVKAADMHLSTRFSKFTIAQMLEKIKGSWVYSFTSGTSRIHQGM